MQQLQLLYGKASVISHSRRALRLCSPKLTSKRGFPTVSWVTYTFALTSSRRFHCCKNLENVFWCGSLPLIVLFRLVKMDLVRQHYSNFYSVIWIHRYVPDLGIVSTMMQHVLNVLMSTIQGWSSQRKSANTDRILHTAPRWPTRYGYDCHWSARP